MIARQKTGTIWLWMTCCIFFSLACGLSAPVAAGEVLAPTARPVFTPTPSPTVTSSLEPSATPATAIVIALESLNVRNESNEHAQVVKDGWLHNGDTVVFTGKCENGWAQIKWLGIVPPTAWVNADYLAGGFCK